MSFRILPSFDSVTLDTGVTDDTLALMVACNIRNIDQSLLRRMKAKAAEEGLTLRDWAIRAFVQALESPGSARESARGVKRDVEKAPTVGIEPPAMPSSSVADQSPRAEKFIEGHKCFCGSRVVEVATGVGVHVTRWKCEKGHYSAPLRTGR